MHTLAKLAHESAFLSAAVAIHRAKIQAANEAADAAAFIVEETLGFAPWDLPGHFVAYEAARAEATSLAEEDGYYWATARISDLTYFLADKGETIPFSTGNFVWTLRGEMPEVHASVPRWVVKTVFGAVAEGKEVQTTFYGSIAA